MFCPTGPSASATAGNPATISLSGVDRNNSVLYVNAIAGHDTEITFSPGVDFTIHTQEATFKIPADATSVTITANNSGARADAVIGTDF